MTLYPLPAVFLFCIYVISANAQDSTQLESQTDITSNSTELTQLLQQSGIENQIKKIPNTLAQTAQHQAGPASIFIQPLMHSLQSTFQTDRMLAILTEDLIKRLDTPTILDALSWYNTENGRQIVQIQKSMLEPAMLEKYRQTALELPFHRKQLIMDIIRYTHAAPIALNSMVNMQAAFVIGLSKLTSPDNSPQFDDVHRAFSEKKDSMNDNIEQFIFHQQAILLQPVTNEALSEFLVFAQSESGQKFFTATQDALDYTLRTIARETEIPLQ